MSSGFDNITTVDDGQQEQPIEISSDSSHPESDEMTDSGSESDGGIINSISSSTDTTDDEVVEENFEDLLSTPDKQHKHYMEMCHLAFKMNMFDKIEVAINAFNQFGTVPASIWLRYLKALKVVTQTQSERVIFETQCAKALSSYYDENLAEFVVKSLLEQPPGEQQTLWVKLLADYGLERSDFVRDLRTEINAVPEEERDKQQIEEIEDKLSKKCAAWNCSDDQLHEIGILMEDFKLKLKASTSNSPWLQEACILKTETLPVSDNVKHELAKVFYERCLTKFPHDSALWMDYIEYMEAPIKNKNKNGSVVERHTVIMDGYLKSQPIELIRRGLHSKSSAKLNHKFLQLMDKYNYSPEKIDQEIKHQFERIQNKMTTTVELHLDYLAYLVRDITLLDEEKIKKVRFQFRDAWDTLSNLYGDMADTDYELLQLWAVVEYKLNSPESAAAIWSEILNYPGCSEKGHLWLAYAQMESEYNEGRNLREIFQQALAALPNSWEAHQLILFYRRYERSYGTFVSLAECQAECYSFAQQCTAFENEKPDLSRFNKSGKKHLPPPKKPLKKEMQPINKKKETEPPKTAAEEQPKPSNFKYSTNMETNKIFIKNLHSRCTRDELTSAFEKFGNILDVRLVYKLNQKFKGIAYIQYETPEEARKAVIGGDGLKIGGHNICVAISNPPPKPTATAISDRQAAAGKSTTVAAAARMPEKRRMPTSLIPTKLVMQEVKRRKKLELDEDPGSSSSMDANGKSSTANGEEKDTAATEPQDAPAADDVPPPQPKSNDDFRKLFNI